MDQKPMSHEERREQYSIVRDEVAEIACKKIANLQNKPARKISLVDMQILRLCWEVYDKCR